MSKPERRATITWADDHTELTHYDPTGRAMLLCVECLEDETLDKIGQAITIKEGSALCEDHLFPDLDTVLKRAEATLERIHQDFVDEVARLRTHINWGGTPNGE